MKYITIALAVALAAHTNAFAGTAQILDFSSTSPPASGADESSRVLDLLNAQSKPDGVAQTKVIDSGTDAYAAPTRSATAGMKTPSWMRNRRPNRHYLAAATIPLTPAIVIPPGCSAEPYRPNPRLRYSTEQRRAQYYGLVAAAACEAGVPAHLLDALVTEESGYNPNVRSPKGAIGMTQLMPDTARSIGVWNAWDVVDNVRGGARYLRTQLDEFKRYDLALGAYNAGPQRVRRFGRVPAIRETLGYVTRILQDVRWSVGQGTFAAVSPPAVDLPPVRVASISAF